MLNKIEELTLMILDADVRTVQHLGWEVSRAESRKEITFQQFRLLTAAVKDKRQELGLYR